ncbi:MAG: hypothetical protein COB29_11440 [Sulfitobacter sp.]|nr:MAG: hypothetical protein COB29_11440 [Sulfitobacter sp.]
MLNDVFGFFKQSQVPLSMVGNLTVLIEWKSDTVNIIPKLFSQYKTTQSALAMDNYTLTAPNLDILLTADASANEEYIVGMPVVMNRTTGGVAKNIPATITDWVSTGGNTTFTFADDLGADTNDLTTISINYDPDMLNMTDKTLATGSLNILQASIDSEQAYNFYVGQGVTVTKSVGAALSTTVDTVINQIAVAYVATQWTATFTFADDIGTNTQVLTYVYMSRTTGTPAANGAGAEPITDATISYNIPTLQAVVPQLMLSTQQMNSAQQNMKRLKSLEYSTWNLEKFNWGVSSANSRQSNIFDIMPFTNNVLMMRINYAAATDPLKSRWDNIDSYRVQINNEDVTNRDIVPGKSLWREQLNYSYASSQLGLNNLYLEEGNDNTHGGDTVDVFTMIPQSIENMDRQQQLQLTINQGTASQNLQMFVYKQVVRELNM